MELIGTAKLTQIYDAFFRAKLFNRIILIYSTITIVTFFTLAVLVYQFSTDSMRQKEWEAQTEAVDGIARYLDEQMDNSTEFVLRLYQNQTFLSDLLYLLRHDIPQYVQYRFNEYIASSSSENRNVETFIRDHMDTNPDIAQIALYSRKQSFLFVFNGNKTQKLLTLQGEQKKTAADTVERMRVQKTAHARSPELNRIMGIADPGAYTFTFGVNDPDTLQNEGALLITFSPDGVRRLAESSRNRLMGARLVLFPDGQVIYDSSGRYAGKSYPHFRQLITSPGDTVLDVKSRKTTVRTAKTDIYVGSIVPFPELTRRFAGFKGTVIVITAIGIFITIMFSYIAVHRYARRTRGIVKAMRLAQQGNLTVRVPASRNDELDEISISFNRMCEELSHYINQVYVSEIRQKHAELVAFQAQINPHFLYNTLEAIRMRALTQGATDVGEMTYVLGSLFRYAVKSETIVTLEEEADYCRQFLELYRVRYKEKMTYRISIDESVKNARLFKLSLQPLVENAFVHGIKPVKPDHWIEIRGFAENSDTVIIEVEDNGRGMEPDKLRAVQETLGGGRNSDAPTSSVGLRNVNERIRLVHGDEYGLEIQSRQSEGTIVRVRLPIEKGEL